MMPIGRELRAKIYCRFFFFQAEDGIRDYKVTGVQTCALPISWSGGRKGNHRLSMKNTHPARKTSRRWRANPRKGAEMMEFTLVFLPMLAMVLVLIDISWAVFAKSTLEYAVRTGVRSGITITDRKSTR